MKKIWNNRWLRGILITAIVLIAMLLALYQIVVATPPDIADFTPVEMERQELGDNFYSIKNNWLRKTPNGFWELYLEGAPFERGTYAGKLCHDLLVQQETAFVNGVEEKVSSRLYLNVLKLFVAWFNRKLPNFVPPEYQKELYGWSLSAADEYDYIGPKYHRKLNYHAAHDIGHALQNMGLVSGCTALAGWDGASADSSLIVGRNFDFYVGDDFAAIKIIAFIKPDNGHPFMMVTWPGMIGAVSGMNTKGITVTLNAGPTGIPKGAKMPVTILARQILQYASTLEEAHEIAQQAETFVSECIVVGSGKENRVVVIEKSPTEMALFEPDQDHLVCANHFQSALFEDDPDNLKAQKMTSTVHRFERMQQLFKQDSVLTPPLLADILRDVRGLDGKNIGIGNEMAINQLIAHHSIIFKPREQMVWIAGHPSQLGTFVAYDLNRIFAQESPLIQQKALLASSGQNIPADPLLYSSELKDYQQFKALSDTIAAAIKSGDTLLTEQLKLFQQLNPEHFFTYTLLGEYYQSQGQCDKAIGFFEKGLTKSIPWLKDRERLEDGLEECRTEDFRSEK